MKLKEFKHLPKIKTLEELVEREPVEIAEIFSQDDYSELTKNPSLNNEINEGCTYSLIWSIGIMKYGGVNFLWFYKHRLKKSWKNLKGPQIESIPLDWIKEYEVLKKLKI